MTKISQIYLWYEIYLYLFVRLYLKKFWHLFKFLNVAIFHGNYACLNAHSATLAFLVEIPKEICNQIHRTFNHKTFHETA